jgi:hypothetical protein
MRAKGEQENHTALWIGFFDFSALVLELGRWLEFLCLASGTSYSASTVHFRFTSLRKLKSV